MSGSDSEIETALATVDTPLLPDTPDTEDANANPHDGLRKVADSIPLSIWLIAIIELCERFAFFGISAPLQNYLQNGPGDVSSTGGLGLGQVYATTTNQMFLLWCYITPFLGAIVAEQNLGRVKTILYSSLIYVGGLIVLFLSSLFIAQDKRISLLGLILALFMIGLGTGGIKTNVSSLVAEQYTGPKEAIMVLKSGEKVAVDRDLTLQRIFNGLFFCINIGSFSGLISTTLEQKYGFTAAFALPMVVFLLGLVILLGSKHRYISHPPDKSIMTNTCRAIWIAVRHKCNLDYARPTHQTLDNPIPTRPWDDSFIDDLKSALSACKIFLLYPFYWAAYSQILTNFISQAATMETHGIPNDILVNIDPISTVLLLPILDRVIFPFFRSRGVIIRHIDRMTLGFVLCGIAMLYAAFVQRTIYAAPPCYDHPRSPDCMGGKVPNRVSVFLQTPSYFLVALSEIFFAVVGMEYAYMKAPKSMKSLVMAVYLSSVSAGALVAMTVSPLMVDPKLTWLYFTLGMEVFVAGGILWFIPT